MSVLRAFFGVSMAAATIAVSSNVLGLGPADADPDPLVQPTATATTAQTVRPQTVRPAKELHELKSTLHLSRPNLHKSTPSRHVSTPSRHVPTSNLRVLTSNRQMSSAIRTINVIASVPISLGSTWVDKCAGPVEVTFPGIPPQIVQHDYCGGLWVLGLRTGERIRFVGAVQGIYVVKGQRRVVHSGDPVTLAAGLGDLAAQTCIPGSDHAIQWVGLTRVG